MRRLALIIAALALTPATAAAADGWTEVPRGVETVQADGERWVVATEHDAHELYAYDDQAPDLGWRRIDLGDTCSYHGAVGTGKAALWCSAEDGTLSVAVIDLATGAQAPVAAATVPPAMEIYQPTAIGTRWLATSYSGVHYQQIAYLGLAGASATQVEGARQWADLDAEQVAQPLCAPIVRPRYTEDDGYNVWPKREPLQRDGDWFVMRRAIPRKGDTRPFQRGELQAWRCGRSKPRRIKRCRPSRCGSQTGAGVVSYVQGDRAVVLRLDGFRRTGYPLPPGRFTGAQHTRRLLIATGTYLENGGYRNRYAIRPYAAASSPGERSSSNQTTFAVPEASRSTPQRSARVATR